MIRGDLYFDLAFLSNAKKFSLVWVDRFVVLFSLLILDFEANPKVFKLLSRKFSKNFKVILNNLGVGDKSEKINLFSNIETSSSTFNTLNEKSNYFKKKYLIFNFFKKKISTPVLVSIIKLEDYIKAKKLIEIDLLKIDTEGYEYKVIKGIGNEIQNIKLIHLEHHFDDMIIKHYTLSDIHKYLTNKGFKKIFKIKMKFRKSFEYIYQNQLNKWKFCFQYL